MSLLAEAGVGTVVAVNASANVVGNGMTRGLNGEQIVDGKQVLIDTAVGGAGGAIGRGTAKVLSGEAAALETQVLTSQQAARSGGGYGAAQSARGAAAKLSSVQGTADVANTVAGAKITNVVAPKVQDVLKQDIDDKP